MSTPDVYLWWPRAPDEHAVLRTHPALSTVGPQREDYHTWSSPRWLGCVPRVGETLVLTIPPNGDGPPLRVGSGAGHLRVLRVDHVWAPRSGHYVVLLVDAVAGGLSWPA